MKVNHLKRTLTILLAVVMLLGAFAGCGKKTEDETKNPDATPKPEYVYLPDYVDFEKGAELGDIGRCFAAGDQLFCISWMPTGKVKELYPLDSSVNPWYFSIDGEQITANKIDYGPSYPEEPILYTDDVVYDMPVVLAETVQAAVAEGVAVAVEKPVVATNSDIAVFEPVEKELTEEELAAAAALAQERQEAIATYIQYDENGELIVPDGYDFYEYDKTEQVLLRMNVDGTGVGRLENYALPKMGEDVQSDGNIQNILCSADGGIWVMENVYSYYIDKDTGEYNDLGESYYLRQIDETGAELARIDLSAAKEQAEEDMYFYINNVAMDKDGNVYVQLEKSVVVMDNTGAFLYKLEVENWINSLFRLGDGGIAATTYEEDGNKIKLVDTAAKKWGETYKANGDIYNCIPGSGDYDLYFNDGMCFYGYDVESGTKTELVNWINCDINGDRVNSIVPLEDGRIVVLLYNWGVSRSQIEMAILSKKPYSALGDKTVLTLACMYDYELRDAVIEFNKKSETTRIEVKSYNQFNNYESENESDRNAGITKLNTEIISGTVPDLIALENLPARQYMAKGLLEDLYPYLDNDAELSRDKLISSVLDAVSFNGALYQTVKNYNITTIVSPRSVVGDRNGWTLSEMRQMQSQMPAGSELFKDNTKRDMLQMFMNWNGSFIDWETGKCSFNSEGFIDLLEYANTFPAEIDWEHYEYDYVPELTRLKEGTLLGSQLYLYDMTEYLSKKTMFGGEMAVMGYPCESGSGTVLNVYSGIAMSSKCKDKEAAWEFLRQQFLPRSNNEDYYYYGGGLPINREDMDALIAQSTRKEYYTDENGNRVLQPLTSWWMDDGTPEGYEMKIMPAEQEDVDEFMAIIESAQMAETYDDEIINLILADAEAFFSGQKSARDTANIIQSKMQTYVNEHM